MSPRFVLVQWAHYSLLLCHGQTVKLLFNYTHKLDFSIIYHGSWRSVGSYGITPFNRAIGCSMTACVIHLPEQNCI